MKLICVYCGFFFGVFLVYVEVVCKLVQEMVKNNIVLVYGGGNVGLMGIIVSEVMKLGGEVIGVIFKVLLDKELGYDGLICLYIVKDMYECKVMMVELFDGFVVMFGGMGILEELFEVLIWVQLGFYYKLISLYNVDGFYNNLIVFVDYLVLQCFVSSDQFGLMMYEVDLVKLIECFQIFKLIYKIKWVDCEVVVNLVF